MPTKPREIDAGKRESLLEELAKALDLPSALKKLGITEEEARGIFDSLRAHTPAPHPKHPAAYSLYVDGASRGNPGLSGAGAVIIDPEGNTVKRLKKFLGTATNNAAEYQALLMGLASAKALHISAITVHADSELMVKQLNGEYRVKSPDLKPFYDEATTLLKAFHAIRIKHVYREENSEADSLANEAIDTRHI